MNKPDLTGHRNGMYWPVHADFIAAERPKHRDRALKFWTERVERHGKLGGCKGCLSEAEKQVHLWTSKEV